MYEKKSQVNKLKKEFPEIEKLVSDQKYSSPEIDKIEYFISSVVLLAETEPSLNNSSQIKRIQELQRKESRYPHTLNIILAIAKGLLDTLEMVVGQR